ncbi:hypothetical protein JT27_00680 [Alcaligenes faecalis]|uniref:hypothetical protein n=1 Tax=Alcaligenes faecalis TaxID=511 RepID=UPI00052D2B84|nr:hypothetical protein [Alcaligenes faecalis]KGP03212.1 hypothetical protein JT27_00680 [Alcaligenes faecalis]
MTDKYQKLRVDLEAAIADAKRQGGVNERAEQIAALLAERDALAATPVSAEPVAYYLCTHENGKKLGTEHKETADELREIGWDPEPLYRRPAPVAAQAQQPVSGADGKQYQGDLWRGWACQYPGKMPRLYGAKEIATANHHPEEGDRLLFLSEQDQQDADKVGMDIEAAAKVLFEQTGRDWMFLHENGRRDMRRKARRVIDAARKEPAQ